MIVHQRANVGQRASSFASGRPLLGSTSCGKPLQNQMRRHRRALRGQGCKIRSGRDRIIRIFESSEFAKISVRIQEILLDFIRNSEMSRTFNISFKILRNSEKFSSESVQSSMKMLKNRDFCRFLDKNVTKFEDFFLKISVPIGAKDWKSCRSRKTLQN